MSTKREMPAPRLAGAILCAAASGLLLLSSAYLFAAGSGAFGGGLLLLIGLGLLMAALKAFRAASRG